MTSEGLVSAGQIGRPHGLDGTFHVRRPSHPLPEGAEVQIAGVLRRIDRRAGTDAAPLVRVEGVSDREAAAALTGEAVLVAPPAASARSSGGWTAADLVGCRVPGAGAVVGVIAGRSCDVLELDDGTLVPVVADAITSVDLDARCVEVDRHFLGLP